VLRQKVVRVCERRKDTERLLVRVVVVVRRRKRRILRRRRRLRGLGGGVRQAVILFPLHAPVLEPDFDLSLGEAELVRHLDAPASREVAIVMELFLKFQRLMSRVGCPCPLAVDAVRSVCATVKPHCSIESSTYSKPVGY